MSETMQRLNGLSRTIETNWLQSPLVGLDDEDDICECSYQDLDDDVNCDTNRISLYLELFIYRVE